MDYDRKMQILHILRSRHYVSVNDLCAQLFVSSSTVRRELKELEDSRQIQRSRGGAYLIEGNMTEDVYSIRERQHVFEKQNIAGQALQLIHDGMTIFLDSSSTVYILAQMIDGRNNLCVITNSLKVVLCLAARKGLTVLCASGRPRPGTVSLVGQSSVDYLRGFNADAAFISACGFDVEKGTSEASEEEARIKRTYIDNAERSYLLCDTSKMGKRFLCRTASLNEFSKIVTEDQNVNRQLASWIKKDGDACERIRN